MVTEYSQNFKLLLVPLNELSMEVLESTFIKGLKPEFKAEMRLMWPNGLGQIIELAQLIEDRDIIMKGVK